MTDPFALLDLAPRFDLDLAEAEKRHRALSRTLHPDRYSGAPAGERRQALNRAILVNEAFRQLKDPVRRAEALLSLLGVSYGQGSEPPPEPDFLMEVMERREHLTSVAEAQDRAALAALIRDGERWEAEAHDELRHIFERLSLGEPVPASDQHSLRGGLGRLRYARRFLSEARALEGELE